MDSTTSVSKGCFVFKNGPTSSRKRPRKADKCRDPVSFLDRNVINQPFYKTYQELWRTYKDDIENLQKANETKIKADLIDFFKNCRSVDVSFDGRLPTAALLTGINQPDHHNQLGTLSEYIMESLSASVCIVHSRDFSSIKSAIETLVYGFIMEQDEDDINNHDGKRLRRSQCTMQVLEAWYNNNFHNKNQSLAVIIPDFEGCSGEVIKDFIMILSIYGSRLNIILILGIVTSAFAVHKTLPYHVISKIKLKVFLNQSAAVALNELVERIIMSPKYNFHLSGKSLKFLTHIFLYYDFSINGIVQGFKYCLMEHFFKGNAYALCTNYKESLNHIKELTHDDIESIRRLNSFRPYVESFTDCKKIIAILTNDNYLKQKLPKLLSRCHIYFILLRCFIELITVLVEDLPKFPLGKQRREIYVTCTTKEVWESPEFKECWQILSFLSKDEFISKISSTLRTTAKFVEINLADAEDIDIYCKEVVVDKLSHLQSLLAKASIANCETIQSPNDDKQPSLEGLSRDELKKKLLQLSKQDKSISEFNEIVTQILEFIKCDIIEKYVRPFSKGPTLYELFVFSDISSLRQNIIGTPKAALRMALNNPQYYFQCKCCKLNDNSSMVSTLPDLSIVYKLHLECGHMINIFDMLQAFRSIVGDKDDEQDQIDPELQTRCFRALAELHFLGYIKASKRKSNHVSRLTW